MVLEKILESPLDGKEIQPVHPKGKQSEYSLEGLMLKRKRQYFDRRLGTADSWGKTLMLGKIEDRRRRGCQRIQGLDCIADAEDINGQPSGDGEGQEGLASCDSWGCKELDTTERLN